MSYVKLEDFDEETDVEEWVMMATECVRLKGLIEVAGYILYHIKGAAKTELCMLGSKVVECMENMFSILRER